MPAFERNIPVRFGDCDPGGWVFYPRYFEMISTLVEDWFTHGLGVSWPMLRERAGVLTPSVHFTADFVAPSRYGDTLTFRLWVVKTGLSSCELRIEAAMQSELRMKVRQVVVFIGAQTERAIPISIELIEAMNAFAAPVAEPHRVVL